MHFHHPGTFSPLFIPFLSFLSQEISLPIILKMQYKRLLEKFETHNPLFHEVSSVKILSPKRGLIQYCDDFQYS